MDHLMDHINMDCFLCKGKYMNMHSEFVLIMYGKAEGTEMMVMKEEVYIHRSLKAGGMPWHAAPYGEG